jgi:hypothetical protein
MKTRVVNLRREPYDVYIGPDRGQDFVGGFRIVELAFAALAAAVGVCYGIGVLWVRNPSITIGGRSKLPEAKVVKRR